MGIATNEYNKNANGGTEIAIRDMLRYLPQDLLDQFQIIPSRVRELDEEKIRILWVHDLVGDPEFDHLKNGGHNKFHKFIFVSNWQMQQFISAYDLPWSKCIVLQSAIDPIEPAQVGDGKTRIIYHTTPHRGLNILVPTFRELSKKYDNLHLDVFSSFKIYGWEERDKMYEPLYNQCRELPNATYHGFASHDVVREYVSKAHIFAYPSTWLETSCKCLIEAMSAGCLCVHPNYGALYETSAQFTWMYQYQENINDHANIFYGNMCAAIEQLKNGSQEARISAQKWYADSFFSWEKRSQQWIALLTALAEQYKDVSKAIPKTEEMFVYNVGPK